MRNYLIGLTTGVSIVVGAQAWANTFDKATMYLEVGMPEYRVAQLLGAPKRQQMKTCGTDIGLNGDHSWTCKIWDYEGGVADGYNSLRDHLYVSFQHVEGAWVVNGWHAY